MDILVWLVLGALAGVLTVLVVYRTFPSSAIQWIGAVVVGLLGGWLGGWLTDLIGIEAVNWLGAFILAFLAATLILVLLRKMQPTP